MNKKGFTLIELMVVIAVIGILAAVLTPQVGRITEKAKRARAQADLKVLQTAMLSYRSDIGQLPPRGDYYTGAGTYTSNQMGGVNSALLSNDGANWDGPYLNEPIGLDPWGYSYLYDDNDQQPCWNSESWIMSLGQNGVQNTGWFPCCALPGCGAGGDDIVLCAYNDND